MSYEPYKLIVCKVGEKKPRVPFYEYIVEDSEGKVLSNIDEMTIFINSSKNVFATMNLKFSWDDENGVIKEKILENLPVEIEIRE